jgi:hypothetical protein
VSLPAPGISTQEDGRAALLAHDLDLEACDGLLAAPRSHQLRGAIHVSMRLPVGVEERRLVGNADVIRQARDDRVAKGRSVVSWARLKSM